MLDTPVYYWTIDIYDDAKGEWVEGTYKYATEFQMRIDAEHMLKIKPDLQINPIKHKFDF